MSTSPLPARSARIVSWIALVLGVLTLLTLCLALSMALRHAGGRSSPGAGFAFLFVTTYLYVFGPVSLIIGLVGIKMSASGQSARKRCWFAVAVGAVALLVALMFGVLPLV